MAKSHRLFGPVSLPGRSWRPSERTAGKHACARNWPRETRQTGASAAARPRRSRKTGRRWRARWRTRFSATTAKPCQDRLMELAPSVDSREHRRAEFSRFRPWRGREGLASREDSTSPGSPPAPSVVRSDPPGRAARAFSVRVPFRSSQYRLRQARLGIHEIFHFSHLLGRQSEVGLRAAFPGVFRFLPRVMPLSARTRGAATPTSCEAGKSVADKGFRLLLRSLVCCTCLRRVRLGPAVLKNPLLESRKEGPPAAAEPNTESTVARATSPCGRGPALPRPNA